MGDSVEESRQLVPSATPDESSFALSVEQITSTSALEEGNLPSDAKGTDKNCCCGASFNKKPISVWEPENVKFWESTGAAVARRNLLVSVPVLMLAYCTWVVW